jgi:hypothetical protein
MLLDGGCDLLQFLQPGGQRLRVGVIVVPVVMIVPVIVLVVFHLLCLAGSGRGLLAFRRSAAGDEAGEGSAGEEN